MNRRSGRSHTSALLALALMLVVGVLGACGDRLDAGSTCAPVSGLCPQTTESVRDTLLDVIVVDTTVAGYPPIGAEPYLVLASRGDSLDTRVIVRYDTLPTKFVPDTARKDSTITEVDTAEVIMAPAALYTPKPTAPVTIDVFDVTGASTDTVASDIAAQFTPDHLLGSKTFTPDSIAADTIRIAINTDTVLAKLLGFQRLRLGFRARSSESVQLAFHSAENGGGPALRLKVSPDTVIRPLIVAAESHTPTDPLYLKARLADYYIVVAGALPPPRTLLEVGGLPGRRSYLRFSLPARLSDSSSIVRATLRLTQRPNYASGGAFQPLELNVYPVLGSTGVTDIGRALSTIASAPVDSLSLTPADSGVKQFEIAGLLRLWVSHDTTVTPRALGLAVSGEGYLPGLLQFYSTAAADPNVRPKLQLTYIPRSSFGLP